jgi:hypothetical protein
VINHSFKIIRLIPVRIQQQNLKVARLFIVLAPLGALTAVAAEILNTVIHYTLKSDLIHQCTEVETGTQVSNYYGNVTELTEAQAKECECSQVSFALSHRRN